MLEVSLVIGSFVTILFFIVGIVIGWTLREYMKNYREVPRPHPEMFDMQGNLIPDEIVAFNFENSIVPARDPPNREGLLYCMGPPWGTHWDH